MKKWKISEPTGDRYLSDQDILDEYWEFWQGKVWQVNNANTVKVRNLPKARQQEVCIQDYVILHWATPVEETEVSLENLRNASED